MKLHHQSVCAFVSMAFVMCLTGCVWRSSRVEQFGGGYEAVIYTYTSTEPTASRSSLFYRDAHGKKHEIWPSFYGRPLVHGNIALFTSELPRDVFVVEGAGPILDITDQIYWRWSKGSGEDFKDAMLYRGSFLFGETNGQITFEFPNFREKRSLVLDWSQISDMMREVKEKGTVRKDESLGVTYLEEDLTAGKKDN